MYVRISKNRCAYYGGSQSILAIEPQLLLATRADHGLAAAKAPSVGGAVRFVPGQNQAVAVAGANPAASSKYPHWVADVVHKPISGLPSARKRPGDLLDGIAQFEDQLLDNTPVVNKPRPR